MNTVKSAKIAILCGTPASGLTPPRMNAVSFTRIAIGCATRVSRRGDSPVTTLRSATIPEHARRAIQHVESGAQRSRGLPRIRRCR
jgi:hypothetical protein